jgi:hypothetical protein
MERSRAATLEVRPPNSVSRLVSSIGKSSTDPADFEQLLQGRFSEPPAWLMYLILIGLQIRIIWGDWLTRDLTGGDTSSYFQTAYAWYQHFGVNILWSPLYTAFYGTFLMFSQDAFFATYVHRIVILITVDVLWFAVVRALLPWPVASLLALWWVHLTTVFNVYYEVHLFVLIPVLLAVLVAARSRGPKLRALALTFLLVAAAFVRRPDRRQLHIRMEADSPLGPRRPETPRAVCHHSSLCRGTARSLPDDGSILLAL